LSRSLIQSQEITLPNQPQSIENISQKRPEFEQQLGKSPQEKKDEIKPQEVSIPSIQNRPVSIFGSGSSLLKQTERGPSTGLFGQSGTSGGLFASNLPGPKPIEETPSVSKPLFGGDSTVPKPSAGLFGQSASSGFGSTLSGPKTNQENVTVQKPLFGGESSQLRPTGGLFGQVSSGIGAKEDSTSVPQKETKQGLDFMFEEKLEFL